MSIQSSRIILKKALLNLNTTVYSTHLCLGSVVAPVIFSKGKRALLIDEEKKAAIVLAHDQEEANFTILILTELIAIVKDLKQRGLILDVDSKTTEFELFYSLHENELFPRSVPQEYRTSDDCSLVYSGTAKLTDGDVTLIGFPVPNQLYDYLKMTLLSVSFPTPDYSDYINHDFSTVESYRTKRALRISWIAIIVAILIGLLTPIVSVFLGNQWGHTVLKTEQFQEIIQAIRDND